MTESMIAKTERNYRSLVENYPDLIIRFDKTYRPIYATPRTAEILNRSPDEVVGKKICDLGLSAEDCQLWENERGETSLQFYTCFGPKLCRDFEIR